MRERSRETDGFKSRHERGREKGGWSRDWSRNEDQGQPMTERVSVEEEGFSQAGH